MTLMLPRTPLRLGTLFSVCALMIGVAVTPAFAGDARSRAVVDILKEERRQLIALGANRAKKMAGVNKGLRTRVASMARPDDLVPAKKPRAKPKLTPVTSFADVRSMPVASGGAEWACLTEALYFEARGETFKGIAAVAEVILNRMKSKRFPNSVCAVISQGVGGKPGCQFSYKCDGAAEVFREKAAYNRVAKIARAVLDGRVPDYVDGALYYHTTNVKPRWSRKFRRTAQVGVHLFYHPG